MYCIISGHNIRTTGMVILVSTASSFQECSSTQQYYHSCCTDVLSTNDAVLNSITIPVVLKFWLHYWKERQYNRNGNTSQYCSISAQNMSTTGMVILVNTASLVERTSIQLEWQYSLVLPFLLY
jgi:hypothetical protein